MLPSTTPSPSNSTTSLLSPNSEIETTLDVPHLPGHWTATFTPSESSSTFGISFHGVPVGSLGTDMKQTLELWSGGTSPRRLRQFQYSAEALCPDGSYGNLSLEVRHDALRAQETPGAYNMAATTSYTFKVLFKGNSPLPGSVTAVSLAAARRAGATCNESTPHNVCLTFPRASAPPLRLYSNRDFLVKTSPYFRDLFASDFREASPAAPAEAAVELDDAASAMSTDSGNDDDDLDSDEENNKLYLELSPPPSSHKPPAGVHEIEITEAAYSTYRAVLTYVQTGFIDFAPLKSTCLPRFPTAQRTRSVEVTARASRVNSAVLPPSPKSVYRLAHFLGLDDLQRLALAHIRSGLRVDSVAFELADKTTNLYDEVQYMVVAFILANYSEVEDSAAYKKVMRRISAGEVPQAGSVMVALLK
ncbi:hypothetical protein JCM6882_005934 [Rhodosporidiobolus microsporus]